jgi:hypothetical protein
MPHAKIPKSFDSLSEAMTHLQIETAAEAKRRGCPPRTSHP